MEIQVSEIFDATKHEKYRVYGGKENKTPYTFLVNIGDFQCLPMTGIAHTCGFATIKEAEAFLKSFVASLKGKVAVVTRNDDFTEGRGPMRVHKVFKNPNDAHHYVMKQGGIYGSPQRCQLSFGVNVNGELYGSIDYNGYDIDLMELL